MSDHEAPEEASATEATESTESSQADVAIEAPVQATALGPDPVIGAGITLSGLFIMGAGGARDLHYVFDVGVLIAVVGAGIFVLFIALSAMKLRRAEAEAQPPSEEGSANAS